MMFSVGANCGFVLFPMGFLFVNVSTAALLLETRQLFLRSTDFFWEQTDRFKRKKLNLRGFMRFRHPIRYISISYSSLILVVPALAGVVLVILSHIDTHQLPLAIGTVFDNPKTWLGVILVLAAVLFRMLAVGCERGLGTHLAVSLAVERKIPEIKRKEIEIHDIKPNENEQIVVTEFISCISRFIAGVALFILGLIFTETITLQQVLCAIVSSLVASIGWAFYKMYLSRRDKVQDLVVSKVPLYVEALASMAPLLIVFFLLALSLVEVAHLDYLIIGALGIMVSNLLVNFGGSKRGAYKALMASLWAFGTITYIFEGYTTDVPLELPVTIFILVLAFRVARLVRRTDQEEEWVIDMFHRIRLLDSKQKSGSEVSKTLVEASESLLRIDQHKFPKELEKAYRKMVMLLEEVGGYMVKQSEKVDWDKGPVDEISEIRRLVDRLAHSRQQGSRFDEKVAICLTGMLIVGGLLFFNGDGDLYSEITSFVLSSIVVFLFFNILDLENDRRDRTLRDRTLENKKLRKDETPIDTYGRYIVTFEDAWNREREQISVVISALIVAVFVGLLLYF